MADLVPMSQAATTSLVTTLQNTDLFALAREDNTSETGYRSKVARVDAMAKKVVNETDYSQLQTTNKKIIGAINEVKSSAKENLSDLTDTTITTPSNADLLAYDSSTSKWVNTDLKGTASGSIATFSNGGNGIPVSEFECEIGATGFSQADISVCGINQWDETWEVGDINNSTGQNQADSTTIRSVGYIPVQPNTSYFFHTDNGSFKYMVYDKNKQFVDYFIRSKNTVQTMGNNVYFIRIVMINYGNVYNNDISINFPSTDTQYHAYTGNLYTVSFGQTIYGGRLIYKNGEWFIDDNGTITPITSSTRVKTISGDNNIYSNTGDCEVKYFTDKADSLAELVKAFVL